jgi:hypothetical protein
MISIQQITENPHRRSARHGGVHFYDEVTGSRALVEQRWTSGCWSSSIERGCSQTIRHRRDAFADREAKRLPTLPLALVGIAGGRRELQRTIDLHECAKRC